MIKLNQNIAEQSAALMQALKGEDEKAVQAAFEAYASAIADDVATQYKEAIAAHDDAVLAQRGFRQLTSAERGYYEKVIDALKSSTPKQAFAAIPDDAMPTTIFEEVLKDIEENHALLGIVGIQNVGAITRWVRNKHTRQLAAWGELNEAITKEITSAFEVIEVRQSKLSAFALVSRDMLELGPVWLDGYVQTVLGEAIACALESGIVSGTGIKGEPIGMIRDIHNGVSVDTSTGYPSKSATAVTDFTPATYGALVAQLATDENGKQKQADLTNDQNLVLICNNTTYLKKVMPATRVMGLDGVYRDSFPVPTATVISNAVDDDKAILALADEYMLFVGGNRGVEYSDDFKFLDDQRAFKIVNYAYGRCEDNTSAVLLDLSKIEAAEVPVKVNGKVATVASA